MIDIYILIPAVIAKIFNPVAELVIRIGIPSQEAKVELEIHPVIVEAKIRKCFGLFTHQFSFLYFFQEIISCFIYVF